MDKNEKRKKAGTRIEIVAILANCFLTAFNLIVGLISGSFALMSEGVHTFSDIGTSVIAYIGFYIGQKPADEEHPLGHGRAEAICGLIIVIFLVIISMEIINGAIINIIKHKVRTAPSLLAAGMAIVGIIVNLLVSQYVIREGKKINSPAIVADGEHQRTDIFSSVAVLAGVIVSHLGLPILDPIIGILIGCIILKTAYHIGKENINNIMGKVPSNELIEEIRKVANESIGVNTTHEIKVDYLGTYAVVTLEISLDENMSLYESHKLAHIVQDAIAENIEIVKYATVHVCPIGPKYDHDQEIDK